MLVSLFLLLNVLIGLFILCLTIAFVTGAPFVPSTKPTALSMIKLANLKKGMKVYDLGSGDGRLLKLAAQKGAEAVGFEINPFLVLYTKLRFFFSPYKNQTKVYWSNFWRANLTSADVVFVYLLPWRMSRLQRLLAKKLKKGSLIVSNSFVFPDWPILRQDRQNHVYVFRVS